MDLSNALTKDNRETLVDFWRRKKQQALEGAEDKPNGERSRSGSTSLVARPIPQDALIAAIAVVALVVLGATVVEERPRT